MRAKCKRYEKYRHKRFHGGLRNDLKNSRVILTKYDVSAIRFRWPIDRAQNLDVVVALSGWWPLFSDFWTPYSSWFNDIQ